ncbi:MULTISPECIES: hypothetical protein [Aquimarina]|uniref:hypothetical protein n=1 Tax=Aquimarina TaxID=290174 RepID=UPI000D69AA91|nr:MULTISPECIES: hypothetical protein [Aquimarina]
MSEIINNEKEIKKRNRIRIYLIIVSIVSIILILPTIPFILAAFFMFSAPLTHDSIIQSISVASLIFFPFIVFGSLIPSWVLFASKKHFLSILFASIPILDAFIYGLTMAYKMILCNGSFDC